MEANAAVRWRTAEMADENFVRSRFDAQELALAGTFAAAAVLALSGQTSYAVGAAAIGIAAMLARGPKSKRVYDVENAEVFDENEEEYRAPHYSG